MYTIRLQAVETLSLSISILSLAVYTEVADHVENDCGVGSPGVRWRLEAVLYKAPRLTDETAWHAILGAVDNSLRAGDKY
jgi:hypothetical protein